MNEEVEEDEVREKLAACHVFAIECVSKHNFYDFIALTQDKVLWKYRKG